MLEEGVKVLFPSRARYCVESDAGVEVVEDFVDFLYLVMDRSWASEAGEGY